MTKKQAKLIIEDFEYAQNGFTKLSGYFIKVVNVKKVKKGWQADIVLLSDFGSQLENYDKCEYPNKLFTQSLTNQK